jgi:UDP-perosamine 4-acetyltransferase
MTEKIIIYGGGGHAKVLMGLLSRSKHYDIVGYVDILDKGDIFGIKYLGNDQVLMKYFEVGINKLVIGISYIDNDPLSSFRLQKINELSKKGFQFPSIVSLNSHLNRPRFIGQGTVIFDGAIINVDSFINDFCVINSGAVVEHDCYLDYSCQIAPRSVLCGNVRIGKNCYIGANSVVINDLIIGDNVLIGAGSVVIRNCLEPGVYVGNPARKIK